MPEVLLGVGELRLLVDHGVELLERVVAGNFDGGLVFGGSMLGVFFSTYFLIFRCI